MDTCEHEHTTEVLFDARINKGSRSERKYEVAYCRDCDRLVNFYNADPMTADEIVRMFKDIKAGIDAIDAARGDLENAIDDTLIAYRGLE